MKCIFKMIVFVSLFSSVVFAADVEKVLLEQDVVVFAKGEALYTKHCGACHAVSNIMVSSPKFGDRDEWGVRLTANKDLKGLAKSALKGKGAMPPKGLCLDCKTKDLEAAIAYMIKGN